MPSTRPKEALERGPASDFRRNTLSQIPSVFGRMVYITSLRNPNTGRYEHHGLGLIFGDKEADKALRQSHDAAFGEWIAYTLEQQKADLDLYLSGITAVKKGIIENWLRLTPYRNLVPASARPVERDLYLSDLETILELVRNEYGVAVPDRDA